MRIAFEFSGGYGGLYAAEPLRYRADTDALPEELRKRLLGLIGESGLLEAEPAPPASRPGPQRDVFTYSLTLGAGAEAKAFTFDDASAPPAARPLLNALRELAMAERRQ